MEHALRGRCGYGGETRQTGGGFGCRWPHGEIEKGERAFFVFRPSLYCVSVCLSVCVYPSSLQWPFSKVVVSQFQLNYSSSPLIATTSSSSSSALHFPALIEIRYPLTSSSSPALHPLPPPLPPPPPPLPLPRPPPLSPTRTQRHPRARMQTCVALCVCVCV